MAKSSILPKSSILLTVLQKFDGTFSCDSAPTTNHIFVVPNYNSQSLAVKQPRIMMISTANVTQEKSFRCNTFTHKMSGKAARSRLLGAGARVAA
jgi:hypothetical protein